ncbi:hypothetical protein [Bacillus oleivorans]|nr:hypothetical protein [Bacillus oleivorans]
MVIAIPTAEKNEQDNKESKCLNCQICSCLEALTQTLSPDPLKQDK